MADRTDGGAARMDANFLIHAREPHPPFNRPHWRDRLTKPDPNS